MPRKIIVMEHHDDLYHYWKIRKMSNIHLVHMDPHCDLYTAFIHQSDQYCFQTKNNAMHVHEGNFLVFALKEGITNKIKWVYDEYGARKYDSFAVKFETDFTGKLALIKAFFKKPIKYPIDFTIQEYKDWQGPLEGEHLSLDWDFFAFRVKDENNILKECQKFIERNWDIIPEYTYVCYSQKYVHSSVISFWEFVESLSKVFGAELVYFRPDIPRPAPRRYSFTRRLIRFVWYHAHTKSILWLHRHGIF